MGHVRGLLAAFACAFTLASNASCGGNDAPNDPNEPPIVDKSNAIAVGHTRELRGVWVASVYNLDYPKATGTGAMAQEAELRGLINSIADLGANAVFLQVRSEGDALYQSDIEPWSRALTGTQGKDPGFDPLEVAIEAAHARGVELHAWINPFRASASASASTAANHVTKTLSEHTITYGSTILLDPSSAEVQDHVLSVIEDITRRYDIDGIHFDDYFYPYPSGDLVFNDNASYNAYLAVGGDLSRSAWRRSNINFFVQATAQRVASVKKNVRFGISPFGIYRPGMPEGINGLDSYEVLGTDALAWLENDWVDYLAPQLYWPTTQAAQSFPKLIEWWTSHLDGDGRSIFAGITAEKYQSSQAWSLGEYSEQLGLADPDSNVPIPASGSVIFRASLLLSKSDLADLFAAAWAEPGLLPPVASDTAVPELPVLEAKGSKIHFNEQARHGLYRESGNGDFELLEIVPAGIYQADLPPGRYAVSAIGANDRESKGIVIELPAQ